MLKKSLISILVFCLITFMSSFIFAANIVEGTENVLRDAGNGIQGAVDKTGDSLRNAKDGVTNMMDNMGDRAENAGDDMADDMGIGGFTNDGDAGSYTATRTNAYTNGGARNNSSLVWLILAVVAIIIVALVWYYGAQTNTNRNSH